MRQVCWSWCIVASVGMAITGGVPFSLGCDSASSCVAGDEGCECSQGQCFSGLVCLSNRCVDSNAPLPVPQDPGGDLAVERDTEVTDSANRGTGVATGTLNGRCVVDLETLLVTCEGDDQNDYWGFEAKESGTFRIELTWGQAIPNPDGGGEGALANKQELDAEPSDIELGLSVYRTGTPELLALGDPSNGGRVADVTLSVGDQVTIQVAASDTKGTTVAYSLSVAKTGGGGGENPEPPLGENGEPQ